jgi:Leucine-rich repeat (LRR) protein
VQGTNITDKGLIVAGTMKTLDELDLSRLNCHSRKDLEKPIKSLTGKGLKALCQLPHLKVLRLADNWLTDDDIRSLPSMKRLTDITLSGLQHFTPKAFDYIGGIENLQNLTMEKSPTRLSLLVGMKNFSQIRVLYLHADAAIRPEDISEFAKHAGHLELLDLSESAIAHPNVLELANLTDLTTLDLRNCRRVTKADIDYLKKKLPGCHIDSDFESGQH